MKATDWPFVESNMHEWREWAEAAMTISEIEDPFDRYCAFIRERNEIYHKKISGEPWPWTTDTILSSYRFTDIYRERDRTSLHYQKMIRDHYTQDDAYVLPATVLYRWFNRVETCEHLFCQLDFHNRSIFETYIESSEINILLHYLNEIPLPHVTGAFIINGKPGYTKGEGVIHYFHQWCQKPWEDKWKEWLLEEPPSLQEMYDWLRENGTGLGSFMAAQLVADLKYLPFMKDASDWWTWAAPGPGSQKGLNAVLGRPLKQPWNKEEWHRKIIELNKLENIGLNGNGIGPFHCQDTQNHCCEFSKYEKTRLGLGRPRQVFRHV